MLPVAHAPTVAASAAIASWQGAQLARCAIGKVQRGEEVPCARPAQDPAAAANSAADLAAQVGGRKGRGEVIRAGHAQALRRGRAVQLEEAGVPCALPRHVHRLLHTQGDR